MPSSGFIYQLTNQQFKPKHKQQRGEHLSESGKVLNVTEYDYTGRRNTLRETRATTQPLNIYMYTLIMKGDVFVVACEFFRHWFNNAHRAKGAKGHFIYLRLNKCVNKDIVYYDGGRCVLAYLNKRRTVLFSLAENKKDAFLE